MTKLLVVDKDGTLVRPKSGNTFVQHPEDQELIEGVAEAIQRYVADGWQVAIASNQGGCEVRWCHPAEVPIRSYLPVGNEFVKCEYLRDTGEYILLNGKHPLPKTVFAKYQYKTIDMAIAEMRYAMNLAGIEKAQFCPNMNGDRMVVVTQGQAWDVGIESIRNAKSFRKPDGGMLTWLEAEYQTKLMVGDRAEDEQAAQAAGFDFMWAHELTT